MNSDGPRRREFLQSSAAGLVAMSLGQAVVGAAETNSGHVPVRSFGRTGEKVSALCLGGHAARL